MPDSNRPPSKVFYLNREAINTDEIIPAKYLDVISKEGLGDHLLEDLDLPGFDPTDPEFLAADILVAGPAFGSGSSREHAIWAIQDAGFSAVVAPSFERIFRENAFNCGLLLAEVSQMAIDGLMGYKYPFGEIDLDSKKFRVGSITSHDFEIDFEIDPFGETLVREGGLMGYALKHYGREVTRT